MLPSSDCVTATYQVVSLTEDGTPVTLQLTDDCGSSKSNPGYRSALTLTSYFVLPSFMCQRCHGCLDLLSFFPIICAVTAVYAKALDVLGHDLRYKLASSGVQQDRLIT